MFRNGFSGSTIKMIAMVAMVIDHLGVIILQNGFVMKAPYHYFTDQQFAVLLKVCHLCNLVGSIAFPLFCFLLVEGFWHTKNVKKYALSLGIFALVTEPLYDWALFGKLFYWQGQNVFFTLFLGLLTLILLQQVENKLWLSLIITSLTAITAYVLRLDGWYYGILLIFGFNWLRDKQWQKYLTIATIIFICGLDISFRALISPDFLVTLLALVIIANYNQQRGLSLKYSFYAFYPLHLVGLKLLADILTSSF